MLILLKLFQKQGTVFVNMNLIINDVWKSFMQMCIFDYSFHGCFEIYLSGCLIPFRIMKNSQGKCH